MNAGIERKMNSQKLGSRIKWNGALDLKIWALETFRGKTVFSGGSWEILEYFGVVGGSLVQKIGLLWNLENLRGFLWIIGGFRVV
jgi:hypothetical protein